MKALVDIRLSITVTSNEIEKSFKQIPYCKKVV